MPLSTLCEPHVGRKKEKKKKKRKTEKKEEEEKRTGEKKTNNLDCSYLSVCTTESPIFKEKG